MHAKRQFSVAALAGKKRARRSAPVEALAVAKAPGAVLGDPKLAKARYTTGELGRGWVYGLNTALDGIGATRLGYALLLIPAVLAFASPKRHDD